VKSIKNQLFVYFVFSCAFLNGQVTDSAKHHLYTGLEVAIPYAKSSPKIVKWYSDGPYQIQKEAFKFRSTPISIGYIYRRRKLFFRSEFLFWYGYKKLSFYHNYKNFDGPPPNSPDIAIWSEEKFKGSIHLFILIGKFHWDAG